MLPFPPLLVAALLLLACGAVAFLAGIVALWRSRPGRFVFRTLSGTVFMVLGLLVGALGVGVQGYEALTYEQVAATLTVRPEGAKRFNVAVRFADGREAEFPVAGDEIYVDAHILKWKPVANLIGLHTAYELDRLAGRYRSIEEERSAKRTVYSLARSTPVDLFGLRQRHAFLSSLLDAEYGSATFVPVTRPALLELRVSTSGLLIREADPGAR